MSDRRIVIAFSEPPAHFRFTRAKSGKCWVRTIEGRQWALKLGTELAAIGIRGIIRKARGKSGVYKPRHSGQIPATSRTSAFTAAPKRHRRRSK